MADSLLSKHPVHVNHVPIATIFKHDDVRSLVHVATKIDQLGPRHDERNAITVQAMVDLFSHLGFGCIDRFYQEEDYRNIDKSSSRVCEFVHRNIICLLKEKQRPVLGAESRLVI